MLESVELFDEYRGECPTWATEFGVSLGLPGTEPHLTDEEVEPVHQKYENR